MGVHHAMDPANHATARNSAPSTDKGRRILDAAISVFAEKGFFNATVAEVARRAGVADGTIYLYYRGKDDLLVRLFEEIMALINERLQEALDGVEAAGDRLRAVARTQARLVLEQPHFAEVISVELRQSSKFMKEYENPGFRAYLGVLSGIIAAGQKRGEFTGDVDALFVGRALFGAFDELVVMWCLARKNKFDLEKRFSEVVEIFVRGLQA